MFLIEFFILQHMFFVTMDSMFGSRMLVEIPTLKATSIIRLNTESFGISGNPTNDSLND